MNVDHILKRYDPEEQEKLLQALLERATPVTHAPVALVKALDTLEAAKKLQLEEGEIAGLSTGYRSVDALTRGLPPGEVTVVFGYTSHGKSQLTQNIALNVARAGTPVLLVPLEMTPAQNTSRFLRITSEERLAQLPIFYPADKQVRWKDLGALVKAAKERGVELVVIDQLQQLSRNVEHQTNEISLITHTISEVAKVHEVHIILISHVSRTGAGGAPGLPDLKGSSSIEQDADVCLAVYRNFNADDDYERNLLHVLLRKNRNRGMQHTNAKLIVKDGVALIESTIDTIFPGGREL